MMNILVASRNKTCGRDRHCDVIDNIPFSLYLVLVTSDVRYSCIYFIVVNQSETRVSTEHGIDMGITCNTFQTPVCFTYNDT